jgi:hypothetical protein
MQPVGVGSHAGRIPAIREMAFAICRRQVPLGFVPDQTLIEIEARLLAANTTIAELTRANAELTVSLAQSELSLKKARRGARQDGNALRNEITALQSRRG